MRFCQSQIHKVTTTIVHDVVIANDLMALLPNCHPIRSMLLVEPNVTVAYANESLHYNIQLMDFHVLQVDLFVVLVFSVKPARLQAAAHLVEVLLVYSHRFIAKKLIRGYYVPEQVLNHDLLFDADRQQREILIVLREAHGPIKRPIIAEVSVDLVGDRLAEWRARRKSLQAQLPQRKMLRLVGHADFGVVTLNNLDELAHDVRKESDASHLNDNCDELLERADRIQITIADR